MVGQERAVGTKHLKLLKILPLQAINNMVNSFTVYPKTLSKTSLLAPFTRPFGSYSSNLVFSQNILWVVNTIKYWRRYCSAFVDFIVGVVFSRAQEQVIWINTGWVVAFVTDQKAVGNSAVGYNPSYSASGRRFTLKSKATIPASSGSAYPVPARISLNNFGPEFIIHASSLPYSLTIGNY